MMRTPTAAERRRLQKICWHIHYVLHVYTLVVVPECNCFCHFVADDDDAKQRENSSSFSLSLLPRGQPRLALEEEGGVDSSTRVRVPTLLHLEKREGRKEEERRPVNTVKSDIFIFQVDHSDNREQISYGATHVIKSPIRR